MDAIQRKSIFTKKIVEAGSLSKQVADEADKGLTPQEKITKMIKMRNTIKKLKYENESYEKRNDKLETKNNELLNTQNALKEQITSLKKQLETSKKEHEDYVKDQTALIRNHEKETKKFQTEIDELKNNKRQHLKMLQSLEHERKSINAGHSVLAKRIVNDNQEKNIKKTEVNVLKQELKEAAAELNQQKSLYNAVVAEKNKLERMFQDSKSEMEKLKEKLKISNMMKQTTKDSTINEKRIIKEKTDLRKVFKDKDDLQKELNAANNTIKKLKVEKTELEAEKKRLLETITEHERLKKEHTKTIRQLKQERDTLNEQNAQKDDKIFTLSQKVKVLKIKTQYGGGGEYEPYVNCIKSLKEENKRLQHENKCLTRTPSRSRCPIRKQSTVVDKAVFVKQIKVLQERLQRQSVDLNTAKGALKEKDQNIKSLEAKLHKADLQAKQNKSAAQQAHTELDKLRKETVGLKKEHRRRTGNKNP